MLDKRSLRRNIGRMKRALTPAQIEAYSRELTERFCETEEYRRAQSVYAYLPYNQEVRTWAVIERAWADGKRVAVPKVYGDEMRFLWIENFAGIAPGGNDIPEPVADEPIADDERALVLMPGLAFDPAGHRVGYGGGFYDKYLESHTGHALIALCYPFQLFERLEVEAHDIPVQRVISAGDGMPRPALRLVEPSQDWAEQIWAYREDFLSRGESMDGSSALAQAESAGEWLARCERMGEESALPEGVVPSTQYLCVREADGRLVGMVHLRHRLNDHLLRFAGHIGYSVRPDERGQGYAKWMLRAALRHARAIGIARALVTCDAENEASRRTILSCGGKYESSVRDESAKETVERYWIDC